MPNVDERRIGIRRHREAQLVASLDRPEPIDDLGAHGDQVGTQPSQGAGERLFVPVQSDVAGRATLEAEEEQDDRAVYQ
jgi:hypothetical protein